MSGMQLADYFDKTGVKPSEFADRIGVTSEAIRLYLRGARTPRPATMQAIHRATGGLVTANDFFRAEAAE